MIMLIHEILILLLLLWILPLRFTQCQNDKVCLTSDSVRAGSLATQVDHMTYHSLSTSVRSRGSILDY